MYDVVESLTEDGEKSPEHQLIGWILGIWEGDEPKDLYLKDLSTVWRLRTLLVSLANCGRTDLVHRVLERLETTESPSLLGHFASIPSTEPPRCTPCAPPCEGRDEFKDRWPLPAADPVFSWAWTSARQVLRDERVLVLAPEAYLLEPFFGHARLDVMAPRIWDASDEAIDPEELEAAPGQFEHICAFFWLESGLDPVEGIDRLVRALNHEGQLHLLAAGPHLASHFDLFLSQKALERLVIRAGLEVLGSDARSADGIPCAPEEAAVFLLRAEKRVV
jgi:hypothetical protein